MTYVFITYKYPYPSSIKQTSLASLAEYPLSKKLATSNHDHSDFTVEYFGYHLEQLSIAESVAENDLEFVAFDVMVVESGGETHVEGGTVSDHDGLGPAVVGEEQASGVG
ncbi:hypothetical protein AVEN_262468-1 [Araneus ventricosus]|uniref:Uncharacterized protein n=1 Tax=Araneus ventricosus TaxID=182803 RepID=A0A4Y2GAC4_ARAVE|nr:hypothetical protein AVEN_262468-1 [Araneus ventricosus]